jgi:hypothetical protein
LTIRCEECILNRKLEKAKPIVRWGRKATDLIEIAGLPGFLLDLAFLFSPPFKHIMNQHQREKIRYVHWLRTHLPGTTVVAVEVEANIHKQKEPEILFIEIEKASGERYKIMADPGRLTISPHIGKIPVSPCSP